MPAKFLINFCLIASVAAGACVPSRAYAVLGFLKVGRERICQFAFNSGPSIITPAVSKNELTSVAELAEAMTKGMLLRPDQTDLFEIYRKGFLGDPSVPVNNYNLKTVTDLLRKHPELSKPLFRDQLIVQHRVQYLANDELKSFLKSQVRKAGQIRSNLFRIDANIGYWTNLLGIYDSKDKQNQFLRRLAAAVPPSLRTYVKDPAVPHIEKSVALFKALNRIRESKIKRGRDVSLISRAMIDLAQVSGFGNPATVELLKSPDGMQNIEGFRRILDERDRVTMSIPALGHFSEALSILGVSHPRGLSEYESYSSLIDAFQKQILLTTPTSVSEVAQTRVRSLSIQEAAFRSCLGGFDCSSRTYFSKALDPNFYYFTRTFADFKSTGHITIVLGHAESNVGKPVDAAFIDKIQNIPNNELKTFIEAVRRSVSERGYQLVMPADAGDHNGISNSEGTRSFVAEEYIRSSPLSLSNFSPSKHAYEFENEYSRAYPFPPF